MALFQQNQRPRRLGPALLRAARSTLVIAAVATVAIIIRSGRVDYLELKALAREYGTLLIAVFLAVAFWDYWFQRTARARGLGARADPDEVGRP